VYGYRNCGFLIFNREGRLFFEVMLLSFASEPIETHDALLTEIVSNDCECIVNIADDKVYVKPERIFPTSQGLFLHLGTDLYFPFLLLFSDDQGCYIQSARIKVTSPCPHCGWERISRG